MDCITNMIINSVACDWHFWDDCNFIGQQWKDFEKAAIGRHVFLFGVGNGADFYFRNHQGFRIEGIIDNDEEKQGRKLSQFVSEVEGYRYGDLRVSDISQLGQYAPDEVVVLITSLKHYGQIMEQLDSYGITRKFVLLLMEADLRKGHALITDEETERYVRESCALAINLKKLVFCDQGSYCGHGKYITEWLLKMRKDLDIVWIVKDLSVEVPAGIRLVDSEDRENFIYEMETAKVWLFDYCVPIYVEKRPGQIYILLKHWSSVTLKTFGLDLELFRKKHGAIVTSVYTGRIMDYIITGSEFDETSCRREFAYNGEVFRAGSSRTDILFRPSDSRNKINVRYSIEGSTKLLLYAPTFRIIRDAYRACDKDMDMEKVREALEERFGGSWRIMLRMHPNIVVGEDGVKMPEAVIDVSRHDDSQELVAACDIMITDYSSIMFEPAYVNKPVFLFAPDRKEYIDGERKLLIGYDTLPFPIAESNEELVQCIKGFDQEEYEKVITEFLDKYGVHEDGHASERAAAFISGLVD